MFERYEKSRLKPSIMANDSVNRCVLLSKTDCVNMPSLDYVLHDQPRRTLIVMMDPFRFWFPPFDRRVTLLFGRNACANQRTGGANNPDGGVPVAVILTRQTSRYWSYADYYERERRKVRFSESQGQTLQFDA
jgi:hypothetical protein